MISDTIKSSDFDRGEYGAGIIWFFEAGEWHLSETHKSKIVARLSRLENKRAVYAFVVDNEAKYVGICDSRNTLLKDRMGSQRSNQCISELIKAALKEEKVVKIFALVPGESEYKGLEVDLLRGLEYPLIEQLNRPDWNRILSKYSRRKYEDERA